ncbi:PREDICTED: uncharacterized protein LOC109153469 [Ipomoea nil]|uniref:uncharacterized protein LOC109153469 n=1 Tax=Ipomoea nil TaxID=35883 RepID=UPI0009010FA1|nr:PREDICTED: uncharacterized protein LOC109153469 [Ipomoea nil]
MNQNHVQRADEFDDSLYLHITENPNLVLVSPPLTELNYTSWSRSMRIALEVKNKFGFVNGTIANPGETDPKYAIWRRCNNIVCPWIFKSLSSTIAEGVLYFEVTADIWNVLRRGTLMLMLTELQNCKMRSTNVHKKENEEDHIIRFLEGLNEDYENIKSGVLVMEPIPIMEKVLNMTLKMERKIKSSINQKCNDLIQANVVQNNQDHYVEEQPALAVSTSNNKKKFNNNLGKNLPKCT